MLVLLLLYNSAFKELHYHIVCPSLSLPLFQLEKLQQPIITGKWFKKKIMFPILYYEDGTVILYAITILQWFII